MQTKIATSPTTIAGMSFQGRNTAELFHICTVLVWVKDYDFLRSVRSVEAVAGEDLNVKSTSVVISLGRVCRIEGKFFAWPGTCASAGGSGDSRVPRLCRWVFEASCSGSRSPYQSHRLERDNPKPNGDLGGSIKSILADGAINLYIVTTVATQFI